jgi:hypothetical protein
LAAIGGHWQGGGAGIQAGSKFSQIQQNPAKAEQSLSKEKAWILLDSLGGIEPFQ